MCKLFVIILIVFAFNENLLYSISLDSSNCNNNISSIKDILSSTIIGPQQKRSQSCLQMQCKLICFNGRADEIVEDINDIRSKASSEMDCELVEELRIYNYYFPNNTISRDFLGVYKNKIKSIFIINSYVIDIERGAFGNGIFQQIYLENLLLKELRQDFFHNISTDFQSLSVIQKNKPVQEICANFLESVKYQIKSLTIQVGITCVRNMTAADGLLNNLEQVDFSYNNFGDQFLQSTFSRLSMVERLILSNSNISYLPDYIFYDFKSTLEYLDLSYNQLITISATIFGWREMPRELKVVASNNPWNCSCELFTQMSMIFVYQTTTIFCETPEEYHDWSVFDDRLCFTNDHSKYTTFTTPATTTTTCKDCMQTYGPTLAPIFPTENIKTTLGQDGENVNSQHTPEAEGTTIAPLECLSASEFNQNNFQSISVPILNFTVLTQTSLDVDIVILSEQMSESYGLVWFSKVTKEYSDMEINYNDYGLGCYNGISYTTNVNNLLPNVAYTFCLVVQNELTTSPFHCKSIHMGTNLIVSYSSWLTLDSRVKGICLVVFGIVLCTFLGIFVVILVLKRKPTLLKGSKRVASAKKNSKDIMVFPRDESVEQFKRKEQLIAKRNSKSTIISDNRRNSMESMNSIDSNDSYMNVNLYEVIPAYIRFNESSAEKNVCNFYCGEDRPEFYLPPLEPSRDNTHVVSYAEIPYRRKRTSNDPLPEVPQNQTSLSLSLSLYEETTIDTESMSQALIMDAQV